MSLKRFPVTVALVASLVLVFAVEVAVGALGDDARLLTMGAISDSGPLGSQYWRLLTYAWLHAGALHLTMNVALLVWVGRIVERRTGSVVTLAVYLAGALLGGLFIALKAAVDPEPGASLGASAAISALLTCALALLHRPSSAAFGQPGRVRVALWAVLVGALALSFLPGVSLVGHVGGLVVGAVLGLVVPLRPAPVTEPAA